jgi:hypothetical protein
MGWRVRDDDLERRSNLTFEEDAPSGRAVGQTQDHMHVDTRLSVVADSDPDRAQHLALLRDLDLLIGFLLEIEPANDRRFEGAYGGERRRGESASFANLVSVANASSPESRMTTRVSEPASSDIWALFVVVRPRSAACADLP